MRSKHYRDLKEISAVINWDFLERLLPAIQLKWNGRTFPGFIDRMLNPFAAIDLKILRNHLLDTQRAYPGEYSPSS